MNRSKKLKINIISSLILQLVIFASGMILPRLFLKFYGSKVNGLISSVQQFLGFITLGEFGIGAVIQYNLYKPLAENDRESISQIIASANKFFNKLLKCILIYILGLALLLPLKYLSDFSFLYTSSLVLSISFSYIMQYYFGMTYRQLLDANQLSFVRIVPQIVQMLINIVVCILLINIGTSVQLVKLVTSMLYSIQPLTIYIYVRHKYPYINPKIKVTGEPIKQKWNGIAQHFAAMVLKDTDVVVLTLLSSLENVSIYSIYNMIIYGVETLIESVVSNFTAVFGELLAKKSYTQLQSRFQKFESAYHVLITVVYFCIGRLIVSFVKVYTYGINDADYYVPVFATILTLAHWAYCTRLPYHIIVKAAGHYKQTQASAVIEASINVVVSVATVKLYGLVGVAIGTACAMVYRSVYYWFYLSRRILHRKTIYVLKVYITDVLIAFLAYIANYKFEIGEITFWSWLLLAAKVFIITLSIAAAIYVLFNFGTIKSTFNLNKVKAED